MWLERQIGMEKSSDLAGRSGSNSYWRNRTGSDLNLPSSYRDHCMIDHRQQRRMIDLTIIAPLFSFALQAPLLDSIDSSDSSSFNFYFSRIEIGRFRQVIFTCAKFPIVENRLGSALTIIRFP